jgi:hypothetical protein
MDTQAKTVCTNQTNSDSDESEAKEARGCDECKFDDVLVARRIPTRILITSQIGADGWTRRFFLFPPFSLLFVLVPFIHRYFSSCFFLFFFPPSTISNGFLLSHQ